MKFKYALVIIAAAFVTALSAQDIPVVRARISPDSISIGDRFRIEMTVEKDLVQIVEFPSFEGEIGGGAELVSESGVDTVRRDGRRVTLKKEYIMTLFDEGIYKLGKMPVMYADKNVIDTLYSFDSLMLMVTSFEIDTAKQQIYDIKRPIETPVQFSEWGGYAIAGFFILQIIFAVVYILFRIFSKRSDKVHTPKRPAEPPHITAIRELERLHEEKLWQSNRQKLYYTRLTDIVREYLENRYGINAMEMTTEETMEAVAGMDGADKGEILLRRLLTTADYVKFAKYNPAPEDNEVSYTDAYYFVENTKSATPAAEDKTEEEQ